jgi:23S rRNA (cytidine1920-2'-O)/16S rRNA (cytidine1409-2'-O)-methyltransferase
MAKVRVDVLLVERGLAESRSQAQRLVMAGQVRVDGQVVNKSSTNVSPEVLLEVDQGPPFVSRGGEKLEAALATFKLSVKDRVCADVGASTGGFSDCLLQHGARLVYAIDVGHGILHWKLRQDSRVVVMERTNARYVERLPDAVSLVTVDASFISLKFLLPVIKGWFPASSYSIDPHHIAGGFQGDVVALIKPQFEAGKREVSRGAGVIRDPSVHYQVLEDMLSYAQAEGYAVQGLVRSPLQGPKGNAEFLAWLVYPARSTHEISSMIEAVLPDFNSL